MNFSNLVRQHWAALRALLVLTVILGIAYPVVHLAGGPDPRPAGQRQRLDHRGGRKAGGQQPDWAVVHRQRTATRCRSTSRAARRRPATAMTRWPPAQATWDRRASSTLPDKAQPAHAGLLSAARPSASSTVWTDARPFCTGDGVGAVLSVIGPRDARGNVVHPTRVVSVNEPCDTTPTPFVEHL